MTAIQFGKVVVAAALSLPIVVSAVSPANEETADFGICRVANVYDSGVRIPRGAISSLRLVGLHGENGEGGVESLGVVPVTPGGAAHFRVPAGRSVCLQALDGGGLAILTMRSPIRLEKGETADYAGLRGIAGGGSAAATSCADVAASARLPVSKPSPELDLGYAGPFSFERSVRPIFDRKCISCHGLGKTDKSAFSLVGANAVANLVGRRQVAFAQDGGNARRPRLYDRSAAASPLWHLVEHGHGGVKLTENERTTLALWLDLNACASPSNASAMDSRRR